MPNNPVQIVLNAQDYVQIAEVNAGGSNKDFYAGRDEAFSAHKRELAQQIAQLEPPPGVQGSLQYACVELEDSGWAKSHRPSRTLFQSAKMRTLGGNDLGTFVVELAPGDIRELTNKVQNAEDQTRWVTNPRTNKREAKPSRLRSEVGAIRKVRLYGPEDRRKFTLDQALEWLSDPRTGGVYYVETFVGKPRRKIFPTADRQQLAHALLENFRTGLERLNIAVEISTFDTHWTPGTLYVIKIAVAPTTAEGRAAHKALIEYLDRHSAVRSILLPPVVQSSTLGGEDGELADVPRPLDDAKYPVVGIIDTGISTYAPLTAWSAGGVEFLDSEEQDRSHGTFIAGLVSAGGNLNHGEIFQEVPCKYFDLGLHPTTDYDSYYPRGFLDFLEQLDIELVFAKEAGVRVFNMSLSVTLPVEDANYSLFAHALDQIADKHNVLFVLPAGNLEPARLRDEWPDDPDACLKMLAEYRHQGKDRIYQPADSLRSVVVGALNPPTAEGKLCPSRYTRRGPGPSLGAKPDLAHVGGRADAESGLLSLTPAGRVVSSCGTSFAAPLVAKTLAVLDRAIAGGAPLEMLAALAVHSAEIPSPLKHRKLSRISKDFVGAGSPKPAASTLLLADSEITLVFSGTLKRGAELAFSFAWPASLVTAEGSCRGRAKLTLVYRPPIDREYGAEFVLVNVDAWLRQAVVDRETGEVSYTNRLKHDTDYGIEKERIEHGAKWWPVKRFERTFTKGVGASSQWRLVLESLCRSEYAMDDDGVAFCAVLTISDPTGEEQIFNEVRQQLQANGVNVADIQIALSPQLRPRLGGT